MGGGIQIPNLLTTSYKVSTEGGWLEKGEEEEGPTCVPSFRRGAKGGRYGGMTPDNPIHLEQEFSLDGDDGEEFNDDERGQSSGGGKKRATRNQPSWFLPEIPTPPPPSLRPWRESLPGGEEKN